MRIDRLDREPPDDVESALAEVLVDCVAGGASVGFLYPLDHGDARAWWHAALRNPDSLTWAARDDTGRIRGTVRLMLVSLPNGRHRAEVAKLLVHRTVRGQGYATALMSTVEDAARALGRSLLVLDTETGSPAQGLYERRGWRRIGVVEGYALTPDGRLAPTTFMAKNV